MQPLPAVFEMATGYWVSQAVYAAAKLGIADLLADCPKSCEDIASATGAHCDSLLRLMRALASLGVVAMEEDHLFRLTEIGAPLQSGTPGSLRSMILTLGEEHYQAWGRILNSIQSGNPAFDSVFNIPLFEYLQRCPAAGDTFDAAMTDFTRQAALAIVAAYDFSPIANAVDVGGGQGALIGTILRTYPHMTGIIFDRPAVVVKAREQLVIAGIEDRFRALAGNFFESVPEGAEAYLLKNVLHDWDDDSAIAILKNCRRAMNDAGRLLAIEVVLPEPPDTSFGNLLDLNMLVMSGGRERTEAEYRRLFTASGFRLSKVIPTMAPISVIEAMPLSSPGERVNGARQERSAPQPRPLE
jgi:hypothetical protein